MRIETERLIIKRYSADDAGTFFYLVKANEEFLQEGFPILLKRCATLNSTKDFIGERNSNFEEDISYTFGIFKKENSELIGHLFTRDIDWSLPKVETGYWVSSKENGKGFASESLKGLTDYLLNEKKFVKIFLRIIPENKASEKVAIKAGFEMTGLLKKDFKDYNGKISDVLYYSRINKNC